MNLTPPIHQPEPNPEDDLQPDDFDGGASENDSSPEGLAAQQALAAISSLQSPQNTNALKQAHSSFQATS